MKKSTCGLAMLVVSALFVLIGCGGGGGGGGAVLPPGGGTPGGTTYTVTYEGNGNTGGTAPVDTTNYQQGQTVTVLGNTGSLVKTGYSFSGWNTAANGSGTTYVQGATFTMGPGNVTLYAKWGVWSPLGPEGGFVQTIAFDPKTPTTVYAGSAQIGRASCRE